MGAPLDSPDRRSPLARLRDHDHTRGSLLRSILALSLPAIATSVVAFGSFQLVDLYLLGQLGPKALAAAGAANQTLRQVVFLVLLGVGTASQMLVARAIGEGRRTAAEHVAGQAMLVGAVVWIVAAGIGVFAAEPLMGLVSTDPAVIALGTSYVRVAFPLLVTAVVTQLAAGILSGAGDTTTPMLASFVTTPFALFFEWVFAFGRLGAPELGLPGIALGAGIGGLGGVGVLLFALFRQGGRVQLRLSQLRPDAGQVGILLRFSWQPALHMLARTGIVFFFMALAGRLGGDVQAAYTIGLRVEMLAIMLAFPIANACATMVSQNLGAGSLPRAWQSIRVAFAVELAALWPVSIGIFFGRHALVGIFTDDPRVAELAAEYLAYSAVILTFYGFYFAAFRSLQAAGDMNSPMIISVFLAGTIAIPLALYLATRADLGATGMWVANLVYASCNTLCMVGWLLTGRWARIHASTTGKASSGPGGT